MNKQLDEARKRLFGSATKAPEPVKTDHAGRCAGIAGKRENSHRGYVDAQAADRNTGEGAE